MQRHLFRRGRDDEPIVRTLSLPVREGVTAAPRGRVLILGLSYFGRLLAGQLADRGWDATYAGHPGRSAAGWARLLPRIARADLLYLISSRIDRWAPQDIMMALRRKPVAIHWVGTDASRATEAHRRGNLSTRIADGAVHWCDAPWLVDELRRAGIRSEYVALPIPLATGTPPPLPRQFRVLMYLPADARDRAVFDAETVLRLPEAFPDVQFTLLPATSADLGQPLPANVTTPGWVDDLDPVYRESTVLVRQTTHDGMAFTAVEALARGRYVIWSYPVAGGIRASGFEAVRGQLESLIARHRAGVLPLNLSGRALALANFAPGRLMSELDRRLQDLAARG